MVSEMRLRACADQDGERLNLDIMLVNHCITLPRSVKGRYWCISMGYSMR